MGAKVLHIYMIICRRCLLTISCLDIIFSCKCSKKLNLFLRQSIKLLPPDLLFLAQICTKSFGGWGFAPDPTGGAYSAPPDPLAGFGGSYFKGEGKGEEGKGREEKGGEGRRGDGGKERG